VGCSGRSDGFLYNKAHFRQAGLPLPSASWQDAGWNWDTFLNAAKKLTVQENGKITRYGFALSGYAWTYWRMWVWQNGGDVVSPDLTHSVLDQTPAIDAIQYYADLANVQHVAPTAAELKALNNPGFTDLFAQGKAAMTSSAPYLFDLRTQLKNLDWDVVPEPMKAKRAAPLWPDSISMNAATKAPEPSWGLLRYVLGPQGQTTITTLGRGVPVRNGVANSPAFLQTGKDPQNIAIYLDAPDYGVVTSYTTVWTQMEQANTEELTPALRGQRTAKEAVSRLVPRINALLQNAGKG
jgi:multiple sugar transport system substrate-binding protein